MTRHPHRSDAVLAIRIVRPDRAGIPEHRVMLHDPAQVRALLDALGLDAHAPGPCPADYADAELWLTLSGADVYAKRMVYVFTPPGAPSSVVTVTTAGCRVGAPVDLAAIERAATG